MVGKAERNTKRTDAEIAPLPLDLENYVTAILTWITHKLSKDASSIYEQLYGISISEWRVISYLAVKQRGTGSEISEFQGLDKGAISRSIATLRKRKIVLADRPNGRKIALRLSVKGIGIYNKVVLTALAREEVLLEGFAPDERKLIIDLLQRLHGNIPRVIQFGIDLIKRHNSTLAQF